MSGQTFYGKYRGTVVDNGDPNGIGRIKARVPDIFGDEDSGWALPSLPYAGDRVGLFLIPPEDAWVWIEFEGGNPDKPIWSGCFWTEGTTPDTSGAVEKKILKTDAGTLTIDDSEGSITIETADGMTIILNSEGIEINAGSGNVKVNGSQLTVNDGSLEVT
ncbi:MAG: hypothetical protein KC415_05780 [Anaerolineales bacterium]|nr:hypothetical protein [Anaerolineales bacterium]MCA9999440.1 hypothetical protein [Anaerolineales bacterium]